MKYRGAGKLDCEICHTTKREEPAIFGAEAKEADMRAELEQKELKKMGANSRFGDHWASVLQGARLSALKREAVRFRDSRSQAAGCIRLHSRC